MFALTETLADFKHMANFTEMHGEDPINGLALKFNATLPMVMLDQLQPGLLAAIYQRNGLRFPGLGPLRWERELIGATVAINGDDLLSRRNARFEAATVDKFVLVPLDGGTVDVTFRVKVKPEPPQVAILFELQHTEVTLTIDPAKAEDRPAGNDQQDELEMEE